MGTHPSLVTLAAVVTTAFVLICEIFLSAPRAHAEEPKWETRIYPSPAATPPSEPPHQLDANDEIAALERIQYALTEVGDGSTYVWRRWHGRLSGIVQPTSSFKDPEGKVCRHMVVMLTTGKHTKKQEGIACRLPSGRWQLDG
jgi:hypothetical protein